MPRSEEFTGVPKRRIRPSAAGLTSETFLDARRTPRQRPRYISRIMTGELIDQTHGVGRLSCALAVQLNLLVVTGQVQPADARSLQRRLAESPAHDSYQTPGGALDSSVVSRLVERALGYPVRLATMETPAGVDTVAQALDDHFAVAAGTATHPRLLVDIAPQLTFVHDPLSPQTSGLYSQAAALKNFYEPHLGFIDIA